jgi:hypothetical protein
MACCGQKRSLFTTRPTAASAPPSAPVRYVQPAAPAPADANVGVRSVRPAGAAPTTAHAGGMVALRAVANGGINVRGPISGRQYSFSAATPVQHVEARDAEALLRTSWFRRA